VIRWLVGVGLVIAMLAFGVGVYHAAGLLKGAQGAVHRPTEISGPTLPGTMYVVQGGAIYRFQHGSFTQITPENGWMQPALAPQNQLVAIRRQPNYSDLYLLTSGGQTVAQLSHNSSTVSAEENHWTFYPRFSPDGTLLYYDFDPKDYFDSYRVDLAIFASPLNANGKAVEWTQPNNYTGGDVTPLPLRGGGLIYTKYSIDDSFQVHGQIWLQKRAGSAGQALTAPELGCAEPALSPGERLIAMVCNKGGNQTAELDVATFDPTTFTLGSPAALVTGQLVASPTFSPDGKTIAFLAPSTPGGGFQLWTVGSSGPASTRDITTDLGLDSASAPVWVP
jgi:Tol biopolymer transport system component